jgi:hypothetical protein
MAVDGITPKWAEGLSHRERRFVEQYLVDLSPTAAMVRIGSRVTTENGNEYANDRSACVAGMQMLAKPHVARAIELALNESSVTRLWIIKELKKLIDSKPSDFFTFKDGKLTPKEFEEIDPDKMNLISKVSEQYNKDGDVVGINLEWMQDKPALRYLAKLLRMEVDRTEISGPEGGAIQVQTDPGEIILDKLRQLKKRNDEAAEPKE